MQHDHRHHYYVISPRGFANEQVLYAVPTTLADEWEEYVEGVLAGTGAQRRWITAREAQRKARRPGIDWKLPDDADVMTPGSPLTACRAVCERLERDRVVLEEAAETEATIR